ncbi:MAG: hypothetical protein HEQ27_18905 [Dolichospermum sp. JUN01]|jgi:hypothetical protein|nr:hypothetical protein [Dolichospermum sp. JUN01]QSV53107.1 MAG: hypothetical protein HEP80_03440 [Dolichospermum sp. UKL201]
MALTVRELMNELDELLDEFEDSATFQVDYQGVRFHVDKIDKDDLANVVLFIGSNEPEDEESQE